MTDTDREFVRRRAGFRCEYCRIPDCDLFSRFEVEHIIPIKLRGLSRLSNLAWACLHCNRAKGTNVIGFDGDIRLEKMVRLFHPRRHLWTAHFQFNGSQIIGRTAIGRVTAEILNFNDALRTNYREQLLAVGWKPIE